MKTMNESELAVIEGGQPDTSSSMAYDIAYGLAGLVGTFWSSISFSPPPRGWHSGTLGGF